MAGVIQVNGTRGELTPFLHSRIDIDLYQAGWRMARNWVSLRFGGMTRMPGTVYMGAQRDGATVSARWLPFKFNREQTYAIEATPLAFRFWNALGQVEASPGVPYAITTPYTQDDLPLLKTRQIGDLVYITCAGKATQVLTRNSETNWTIEDYEAQDGPYLPLNTSPTTLTPASYGSLTPVMSGLTTPSGTVTSTGSEASAWQVFDQRGDTYAEWSATTSGFVAYELASGNAIVNRYWVQGPDSEQAAKMPISWVVEGSNNGSSWVALDTRQAQNGWTGGEVRFYEFANETAYVHHRFRWLSNDDTGGTPDTRITEIVFNRDAASQTAFNLTASSVTGLNNGTGFQTSDVGRSIRLRGSDGIWRWAEIVSRTSTTVVTIKMHGHALPDLSPIINWRMSLFGTVPGFPTAIGIHEDRLVFAGYPEDPTGIVTSVSADYDNFNVSSPVVDDDAVSVRMSGGELNAITWLSDGPDIIVGTEGSIRALGRNENARAFAPGNTRQRTETEIGTSYIEPIKIEQMLLVLDTYRSRFYEVGYSEEVQGYIGRELSALNEHLTGKGVKSWAYQASPHKIIWCVTDEGTLLAATYDREEKVFGVTECELGPDSFVEAVLTLPSTDKDGDQLWLTVRRTVNGATVRYVERLSAFYREGYSEQEYPIYAHSAGVYEGAASATVTGLDYLMGVTVGVWADGLDLGDATIVDGGAEGGVLTLPGGFTAETIVWGIRANSRLETLRLASMGPSSGPQIGQRVNLVGALVDYYQTTALSAGTLNSVMPIRVEADQEENPYAPAVLRSGSFWIGMDDSWENNGVCVIETNSMHPATVLSITMFPEGEP